MSFHALGIGHSFANPMKIRWVRVPLTTQVCFAVAIRLKRVPWHRSTLFDQLVVAIQCSAAAWQRSKCNMQGLFANEAHRPTVGIFGAWLAD